MVRPSMGNPKSARRWLIVAGSCLAGVAILGAALAVAWSRQASGVSLLFTGYKRWPADSTWYAEFQLINKTTNAILDPLLRDGGPTTAATLSRERTSTGWTAVQWEPYAKGGVFVMHTLKAGKPVDLIVPLAPGASPKRIAVPCDGVPEVRRSALSLRLRRWLAPVGRALKIDITPPEVLSLYDQQIWCDELVLAPKSDQPHVVK